MIPKKKRAQRDFLLQLPGYLLVCSFITAVVSGLLIAFYYIPTPSKAALSIIYIQEKIFAGTVIITIHRLSSILIIIFTLLNLIIILPSKKISDTWIRIWQSGIVLIILFLCLRISGYILSGSNSSAYLLKSIIFNFTGNKPLSTTLPTLFGSFPIAFIRFYILHIIILPGLVGLVLYKHIKGMKHFGSNLQPVNIHPTILFTAFITLLIIISIFTKPTGHPISGYTENHFANMPMIIQFLVGIKRSLSLPATVTIILIFFILVMLIGDIINKYKNKDSHKDTKTQRVKQH